MKTLGEMLSSARKAKKISTDKAASDLLIKKENLEALEEGKFEELPEPAYIRGFIKNYAKYLSLDPDLALAIYRRQYDETKYPKKAPIQKQKGIFLTPNKIVTFSAIATVIIFVGYLVLQYLSILSTPKLDIIEPKDDVTTAIPIIQVSGQTEKEATVSVNGEFAPVTTEGQFTYQLKLTEGQNIVEIIAAKRLSPKNKQTRLIRLAR